MSTEINHEAPVTPEATEPAAPTSDKFEISKAEYDELVKDRASLGSLKREFKDLKKSLETRETEAPAAATPDALSQKAFLRSEGIKRDDEVALALETAKKWGMDLDKLVDDEDFQVKLEKLRTKNANIEATAAVEGGGAGTSAKLTPAYWIAKGVPPTAQDVPDRKARVAIQRAMMEQGKNGGKTFYND